VHKITFVDNGRVAYSNPVRQSLFEFADCVEGGAFKATAAAEHVKKIRPTADAKGVVLTIPMVGHPLAAAEVEGARDAVRKMEELIDEHDVVFLLTDTRESRWLPTVLCAAKDKMLINVALGFDTFLVMRHGSGGCDASRGGGRTQGGEEEEEHKEQQQQEEEGGAAGSLAAGSLSSADSSKCGRRCDEVALGCYFCNDIVAPANSMRDRTLDQQCTVTRPGLAPIASAMGVELAVGLLHHPRKQRAPPPSQDQSKNLTVAESGGIMGSLPHQVRGFLATFHNVVAVGHAFDRCTGCSASVLDAYRTKGFEFLRKGFDSPAYLEELSGLLELRQQVDDLDCDMDWDEGEEGEDDF
jgi:ubiquitin-like modifier-activating enzyme ATG7